MKSKTKASILTMIFSIVNSVVIVVFNLVYNNLLIRVYGSEVNGLISTLTQFVSLFSIIEGGFVTAAVVATYAPIKDKNYKILNDVLYTTKRFYFRIGITITACVLVFGSVYINFIESPFGYLKTYAVLIVSVFTTVLSLCFMTKYSIVLQGDNKAYIQNLFSFIAKTATWIISVLMITFEYDILLVYAINIINVLFNILLVKIYEKKHYPFVNYKGQYDKSLIKGTKDILFQKIANTIFTSTDLILISTFISLSFASVYNLYFQVFKAILVLLSAIVLAPFNSFGQLAKDKNQKEKLTEYFDIYQNIILMVSTVVLTTTGVLIIPFVEVYTLNITDFEYVYPALAILFFSQIYAQIINKPFGTILNATGNFKTQNIQCGVAAIVNIIVSVAFIKSWGINSVVFGSFVGTLVILVMNIYQAHKNVVTSSVFKTLKNVTLNYLLGMSIILLSFKVTIKASNYFDLALFAVIISLLIIVIVVGFNALLNKKDFVNVYRYLKSILLKNK